MVDLLRIPAFLFAVFGMFWAVPLLTLFGYLRPFKMSGLVNPAWGLGLGLARLQRVRILEVPSPPLYKKKPVIFLANHRSWADFFMDVVLTEGRSMMLSRMAVAYAFPAFMGTVYCLRAVILFKRGRIPDKKAFNEWIDSQIAASPQNGLLVYPEGHRSIAAKSLPLKRGMLHYAHSRKMPVQVISTRNKELMLSEKEFTARYGVTLAVARSEVIESKDFPDFEEFMAKVQLLWDQTWQKAETADLKELKEYKPEPLQFDLDKPTRLAFLFNVLIVCLAFLATLAAAGWLFLSTWQRLPHPLQIVVPALLALWSLLSAMQAQVPAVKSKQSVEQKVNGIATKKGQ